MKIKYIPFLFVILFSFSCKNNINNLNDKVNINNSDKNIFKNKSIDAGDLGITYIGDWIKNIPNYPGQAETFDSTGVSNIQDVNSTTGFVSTLKRDFLIKKSNLALTN